MSTSTPRSLYKDLPLKSPRSIRILKFDDAVFTPHVQTGREAGIRLSLRVVNLDDKPDYHALSYTWGPPTREAAVRGMNATPLRRINCNGESLLVTQNLFACLQQLARDNHSIEFWIDVICIDQESQEKNQQVNLMAEIYKNANNVIIWLGNADKQTDLACAFIKKFAASRANSSGTDDQGIIDELKQRAQLSALASFFNRTWFTRVWAVQELVLAQATTVLCGSCVFDWDDITEVSHYLATSISQREFHAAGLELRALSYKNPAKLAAVKKDLTKLAVVKKHLKKDSPILLHSLIRFRNWDSSREHDKVYALLGIHKAALELEDAEADSPLYPHYERDVSKAYIGIARYILEHSSDLLLLAHHEGEDFQTIPSLPSWVPDWNVKGTFGLGITGYERFSAAAGTEAYVKPEISEQNVLTLRAAKLDTVVQVGETKEEVDRGMPFVQWLDILRQTEQLYHTGEKRQEVLWRSLITNTDKDGKFPAPDLKKEFSSWIRRHLAPFAELSDLSTVLSSDYDAVLPKLCATAQGSDQIKGSATGEDVRIKDEQIEDARKFDSLYSHALLLRLFRTDKGYIGVGSKSMKMGDSVWIVPGSRVPLLFRPSAWTEGQWRLVGGAYVHGFMRGEASESSLTFESIRIE